MLVLSGPPPPEGKPCEEKDRRECIWHILQAWHCALQWAAHWYPERMNDECVSRPIQLWCHLSYTRHRTHGDKALTLGHTILSPLPELPRLIFMKALWGWYHYYQPHFSDEETEKLNHFKYLGEETKLLGTVQLEIDRAKTRMQASGSRAAEGPSWLPRAESHISFEIMERNLEQAAARGN